MTKIDRLLRGTGDVRKMLRVPENDVLDLSDEAWDLRLDVLTGLEFRKVHIAQKEILINFVDCSFNGCEFCAVNSDGHFWGASNNWRNCSFDSVTLAQAISPMNTFRECRFDRFRIDNYSPYQTLFADCVFRNSAFTAMRAKTVLNLTKRNWELEGHSATVVFRKCKFLATAFEGSYFSGVCFEDCDFEEVTAKACDFSGIESKQRWWNRQESDPFQAFLLQVLELITTRCGKESAAHEAFEGYMLDYLNGKTAEKNFSACLYSKRVPYSEILKFEPELRRLVNRTAF